MLLLRLLFFRIVGILFRQLLMLLLLLLLQLLPLLVLLLLELLLLLLVFLIRFRIACVRSSRPFHRWQVLGVNGGGRVLSILSPRLASFPFGGRIVCPSGLARGHGLAASELS